MKRVFAHLGFSAAVMLLILNFFSVTFAYIALGVVLAALCLVLSVPRLRQGVSVWLCLVGAVVACVTFIVGVHATYLPQQKLIGQTAQVQFYVTDVRRGAEKNDYTVKTTALICLVCPRISAAPFLPMRILAMCRTVSIPAR